MAKNVTYTCDRCQYIQSSTQGFGPDSDNPRIMYTLHLIVHQGDQTLLPNRGARYVEEQDWSNAVLWCNVCLKDMHIRPPTNYTAASVTNAEANFETLIREMVRDEIQKQ